MTWDQAISLYERYLKFERNYSANTLVSYVRDVKKLQKYAEEHFLSLVSLNKQDINDFIFHLNLSSLSIRSQARLYSSLKNFFSFLYLDGVRMDSPTEHLETPKMTVFFPNYLTLNEINQIVQSIDRSNYLGERNYAIIEMLYGCGMRVSELLNLRLGDLFFEEKFIRVVGKGNKERLIPIADATIQCIENYIHHIRVLFPVKEKFRDILFLNRRGSKLTREMIFTIIKELSIVAEIDKKISPHTFRHSFATHLLQNGADLRSIQLMLGHENLSTTQIYTHSDLSKLRKTILKFHPRNAN